MKNGSLKGVGVFLLNSKYLCIFFMKRFFSFELVGQFSNLQLVKHHYAVLVWLFIGQKLVSFPENYQNRNYRIYPIYSDGLK